MDTLCGHDASEDTKRWLYVTNSTSGSSYHVDTRTMKSENAGEVTVWVRQGSPFSLDHYRFKCRDRTFIEVGTIAVYEVQPGTVREAIMDKVCDHDQSDVLDRWVHVTNSTSGSAYHIDKRTMKVNPNGEVDLWVRQQDPFSVDHYLFKCESREYREAGRLSAFSEIPPGTVHEAIMDRVCADAKDEIDRAKRALSAPAPNGSRVGSPDTPSRRSVARKEDGGLGHFTIGSTKDEVLSVQGTPDSFSEYSFTYGASHVYFEDGRVTSWDNGYPKLKVRMQAEGGEQ